MFSMLVISCDPTEIVEPDLINFGFTEDYTNTLQIQAHTAYVSLPYGSTLTSLQINGDVLWGPDFVINGDHSVIYQFDTIYSTHNGMGVYRDTTNYVLTLGDAVYSGTLIKPDYPQLQLLALDMQEDYHFTWSTQKSPDNFLLNVGFFGGSPELNVQLSGKKRGYQ